MSSSVHAVICPNCGGQVEFAAGQYQINCKFCGTLVERERPPEPQKIIIQQPYVTTPTYIDVSSTSRAGAWIGIIIAVVTLVIIGGVFLAVSGSGGSKGIFSSVRAYNDGLLIPRGDGQLPDMVVLIHDNDSDKSGLLYASAISHTVVWQNTAFDKDTYRTSLAASGNFVYATNKAQLIAYQRSDGKVAWQVRLADEISCDDCLYAIGPAVVSLAKDGSIQAFDAKSGSLLWNWRLNSTPDRLIPLDGRVAVADRDKEAYLSIFDVTNGQEVQRLTPTCTADPDSLSDSYDSYSPIVVDPTDQSLYLMYGTFSACVQRWDSHSGKMLWQSAVKNASFSFASKLHPLQTVDTLILNGDKSLILVNTESGRSSAFLSSEDYNLIPWAIKDNTLLVEAKRQRGSTRFELWGVDLSTGQTLWQLPFDKAEPIEEPNKMAGLIDDTSPGFTSHLVSSGLAIIIAQAEPHKLVLQAVNPKDGTNIGEQRSIGVNAVGSFYDIPDVLGWSGDTSFMIIDGNVYVVNVVTGDVAFQW